ncbi:serine/threonine-protein phosphatase 6 regulatory ankyrin repeat subunit B isoform X2 [Parasteatoda tepidariorum]|nr:serine/threonine-protein phosphatase 6 regulatory ankyrin repeat subunit B isoform X2 [Parasteatoda tepidariorum]XP_042906089.1 serine/threonine-protein phosphatase 6 regulatory ankyrin repeat subunit B isoform X2 [Parasteatoda tepidariorum]
MALDFNYDVGEDEEMLDEKFLVEAAAIGDFEKVFRLLKAGISVDAEEYNKVLFYASKNYMTPLQLAAEKGHSKCVDLLIAYGADVNARNRFDVTALHMAAEKGHYSCLKSLLEANAECSLPTKFSKTGSYTAVPHLGGTTPLHLAADNNHIDCVRELIQYGADYNAVDERGRTSLYIAAKWGYGDCILAHLKNAVGRDILSLPSFETSDTPLHFAVSRGLVECVSELLKFGSDVNHMNYAGNSPLHLAVTPLNENESVSLDILKMLILEGYNVDINQQDGSDLTPLHFVCFNGRNCLRRRPEMAKFLIAYGANVDIRNNRGFTLLEWELKLNDDLEILRYIVRSMLHLPRLGKLRISPQLPYHPHEVYRHIPSCELGVAAAYDISEAFQSAYITMEAETKEHIESNAASNKHVWYETLACNPRTLQHNCRFTIRKALGSKSMKYIHQLPLPSKLKSYLLLEYGD